MSNLIMAISLGPFTDSVLKTGFNWSKILQIRPNIIHIHPGESDLQNNALINEKFRASLMELREDLNINLNEEIIKHIQKLDKNITLFPNTKVRFGKVIKNINEEIGSRKAKLLIMGTHSKEKWSNIFLGSTTERILKLSEIPVLIIKDDRAIAPKKIFWASDLTELADYVFEWVKLISSSFNADINFCHVLRNSLSKDEAKKKMEKFEYKLKMEGITYSSHLIPSDSREISEKLINEINNQKPDLVILGARQKQFLKSLFIGNIEEFLMNNLDTSFLLVKMPKNNN